MARPFLLRSVSGCVGPKTFSANGHDFAEAGYRFVVLSLAILRIGETSAAPKSIGMLGADRLLTSFSDRAQDIFSFAVGALFDEQIANGVLDLRPLSWISLAIGQLLRGAEMFHGCLELDPFLRGEAGQFQRLDNLSRLGAPGLLRFVHGLQGQAFSFKVVLRDIGSVSPFIAGSVRRAL